MDKILVPSVTPPTDRNGRTGGGLFMSRTTIEKNTHDWHFGYEKLRRNAKFRIEV
jgi:hypothetical protein